MSNIKPAVNKLFPVFLKLEQLKVLLIGGGNVALEKITAILNNSPETKVTVVADIITAAFEQKVAPYKNVTVIKDSYRSVYLHGCDVIISAVNSIALSEEIRRDAHAKGRLINCADKPELCDFYLGSVVTKGNMRIAISTNGKSPTLAKRMKELLNDVLPEEIDELLNNLQTIRNNLKGDMQQKVSSLNELTKSFVQ